MSNSKYISSISFVLSALALSPGQSLAQENASFEVAEIRRASEILPDSLISGPYHQVVEEVDNFGYLHHYIIKSDFGEFEAVGDAMLKKLVPEFQAIAKLRKVRASKAFASAVKEGLLDQPVDLAKNMITNPVGTVTGIPTGFFMFVQNTAVGIGTMKDRDEYVDSLAQALLTVSGYNTDRARSSCRR